MYAFVAINTSNEIPFVAGGMDCSSNFNRNPLGAEMENDFNDNPINNKIMKYNLYI